MLGKIFIGAAVVAGVAVVGGMLVPYDSKGTAKLQIASDVGTSAPNVADTSKWVQTFGDEFAGTKLDASKWVTCYDSFKVGDNGCTNSGNAEQEWYVPSQVGVGNGIATLTAVKQPILAVGNGGGSMYPYESGMISTGRPAADEKPKWATTYGYFEARIKYDGGKGVWPAFWLLPSDESWPPEIDIMEHLGNETQVPLTVHWPSPAGPQKDSSRVSGHFVATWHTYAVNWQPNEIDWYIDGHTVKTVRGSMVPKKPMEIIFDLAIGGRLPGNADASTPFPRTMQIDYVHVYEMHK